VRPGDVVIGLLPGAVETKARPAIVIASERYLSERPDVLVGIVTSRKPTPDTQSDCPLRDWRQAALRVESWFRTFVITMRREDVYVIGRLSSRDWGSVQACVRAAFDFEA
jgi:mRNA interferase MazF